MRILKTGEKTSREICQHHQVRFGPHFLHSLLSRDSFPALHHLALKQDCREKPARDRNSPIKGFCSIKITFTTVSNHSSPSTQRHRPQRARKSVFFLFTGAPLTTRLNARLHASFQKPEAGLSSITTLRDSHITCVLLEGWTCHLQVNIASAGNKACPRTACDPGAHCSKGMDDQEPLYQGKRQ